MSVDLVGTSNGALHVALKQSLLDEVYEKVSCGRIDDGMNAILPGLLASRLASSKREWAALSVAVKRCMVGRFVALDFDLDTLREVQRCYGRFGVESARSSIRRLLTQKTVLGEFDVVYATGLFDYLQQATAERLAWVMFQALRPGGRLLVANFMPGISDLGYMESYMEWKLIYRTRREMMAVADQIPQ